MEPTLRWGVGCALVCDEFGEVTGLVTLCDILGSLVGSVEVGTDEEMIIPRVNGQSWLIDGQCPIYDFLTHFDIEEGEEASSGYSTIAGLVLNNMRRMPLPGETITFHNPSPCG